MSQETSPHPNGGEKYPIDRQQKPLSSNSAGQAPYDNLHNQNAHNQNVQNQNVQNQSDFGNSGFAEQTHLTHNVQASNGGAPTHINSEESPDLLRWRADSLLDEMMLGGADGSAAQGGPTSPHPEYPSPGYPSREHQNNETHNTGYAAPSSNGNNPYDYGEGPAHDGSPYQHPQPSHYQAPQPQSPLPQSSQPQQEYQQSDPTDLGEGPATAANRSDYGAPSPSNVGQAPPVQPHASPLQSTQPPADTPAYNDGYSADSNQSNAEGYRSVQDQQVQNQAGTSLPGPYGAEQQPSTQQPSTQQPSTQQPSTQQPFLGQPAQDYPAQGNQPHSNQPQRQERQPPVHSNLRQPTAAQNYPPPQAPLPNSDRHAFDQSGNPQHYGEHPDYNQTPNQPPQSFGTAPRPQSLGQQSPGQQSPGQQSPGQQPYPSPQPMDWASRPSFEQGDSSRLEMGYEQQDFGQGGYPPPLDYNTTAGAAPSGSERPQQPLDPATYYAQQIAWRREQERKQWAISSGSSSDYLTSVPRYEEAQNRTASYNAARHGAPATWQHATWQQQDGWQQDGYQPQYDPRYPEPGQLHPSQQQPGAYQQPRGSHSHDGIHARPPYTPQLGPVNPGYGPGQQPSMPFAERMDVGAQAQRRSNLLPRRTQMSIDALYEEMTVLQSQVDMALPIYGDSADRALHLLEKGRGILEQNPERSAEVAYYVQQVSGIIQRGQQRLEWSNTYRSRLSRYLTAWLVLGCLGVIGSYVYSDLMVGAFSAWFPSAARFFSNHLSSILLVSAASILGSALAALINMWRHGQKEYGFFDRKYGLLGVLLPLMGLVVGLVIYFAAAIIYLFLNISPNSSWIAQSIPALLALIFGFNQEKIYGTSE